MLSKGRLRSNGEAARKGPREVATSGAQEKRLANNTTTLAAEYAKQGKDWETELRPRAKEKSLMDMLGLSPPEATPQSNNGKEREEDDEGDE